MTTNSPLRLGIVGCGYQGGVLAKAVAKSRAFALVACVDTDRAAAEKLAGGSGSATAFTDLGTMLAAAITDVVFVATPHHLLAPSSLSAIRAGQHVMCEKPIGLIEAEAAQIEQAAAQAGVQVEAGYSFRRLPAWETARDLIRRNAIGEIASAQGYFATAPMNGGWKSTPEKGGGPLLYVGSHLIDQLIWYFSDTPVEVFAATHRRADTRADEISTFQIRFARGAVAQCSVSQVAPALDYGLTLLGRAGRMSLRTVGFLDHEISVVSTALPEFATPTILHPQLADDPRLIKHVAQLEDFAQAIAERRSPRVGVADARAVLTVIDGIFRSGESGLPVSLNVPGGPQPKQDGG